jgi:hypothetical protein
MKENSLMEPLCGMKMEESRLEEEVARLFFEKVDFVLGRPGALLRILNSCASNSDILVRRREEWGVYLDGLEDHGVRRVGKIAHMVIGSSGDEVVVVDPLNESSLILVPRDFAFRMVVMGGLP